MSFQSDIKATFDEIALDVKSARFNVGSLGELPTANKTSIVAAIAELYGQLVAGGAIIDDQAQTNDATVTYSAAKITNAIATALAALKVDLLAGASDAWDTFKEIQNWIESDGAAAASLATAMNNRLRFDEPQILTGAQKQQAADNLGLGNITFNFLAAYVAAKA